MTSDITLIVERTHPLAELPRKAHDEDACFDLYSIEELCIKPGQTGVVNTGICIQLPIGWEAQIRGRSGLASKGLVAHPGTIDALYREELKVILHNLSSEDWKIALKDRVAQMKLSRVWTVELVESKVQKTSRSGLGSTGK